MKCSNCGRNTPLFLETVANEIFCDETCMHYLFTEQEIEWLFDHDLIEWKEEPNND